jgi:hypothetical protein
LNLDCLKQKDNIYKKIEQSRNSYITTQISTNRCIDKNNTNITNKKKKELYPISARELNINNENFVNNKYSNRNCIGVLRKNNKNKNKTFKNSLNETCINSILFSYTNSNKSKNKFVKKTQEKNNQNLILSNFITKTFKERNDSKKANYNFRYEKSPKEQKKNQLIIIIPYQYIAMIYIQCYLIILIVV